MKMQHCAHVEAISINREVSEQVLGRLIGYSALAAAIIADIDAATYEEEILDEEARDRRIFEASCRRAQRHK